MSSRKEKHAMKERFASALFLATSFITPLFLIPLSLAAAQPVKVEHKYGTTVVPEAPERIVTVGLVEQDALLALGTVPVGTTEWIDGDQPGALWPWARERLDELGGELPAVVGDTTAVNLERILALEPDLILALYSGITRADYEQLSRIAPTVAQPAQYVDYGVPWQELTRTVGRAVGKADEAEAVVAEVEARFAAVQAQHPEFVGRAAVVATPYQGIYLYGPEDLRGRFLRDLGFRLPEGLDAIAEGSFGGNISMERTDLLEVDAILWLDADPEQEPLNNLLYENLRVHTEGREIFLDSYTDPLGAATSFVTPLSLPFLLDGLVPKLDAAIDGDPATPVPTGKTAEGSAD
jgi:iron complex transport system substrate-binding protein